MRKTCFLFLFIIWAIPSGFAQLKTYSFEQVELLNQEKPKPIVVFIHTSWCKYCHVMRNSTFKNQALVTLLNNNFYFVSFDAETKNNIKFKNYTFKFKPTGPTTGVHELATALATINSQVSYPTLTVLDADYSILFQQHSFQNAKELISILEKVKQ
jgi:thioredoxin-related protein